MADANAHRRILHLRAGRYALPLLLVLAGLLLWQAGIPVPGLPVVVDLGTLGGRESVATDINDRGQVVGKGGTEIGAWHAFLWEGGRMRDLGTLGGQESCANAINNRGQVVGWAQTAAGRMHACLWGQGRIRDLGTLPGFPDSEARDINSKGQVVGESGSQFETEHRNWGRAFPWESGRMRDLTRLAAGRTGQTLLSAEGINDLGDVVGCAGALPIPLMARAYLLSQGRVRQIDRAGGSSGARPQARRTPRTCFQKGPPQIQEQPQMASPLDLRWFLNLRGVLLRLARWLLRSICGGS